MLRLLPLAVVLSSSLLVAQERPKWDQEKAEAIIRRMLEVETQGQAWNGIAWLTDPKKAREQAERQDKAIFVYCFMKTDVGPKEAPC